MRTVCEVIPEDGFTRIVKIFLNGKLPRWWAGFDSSSTRGVRLVESCANTAQISAPRLIYTDPRKGDTFRIVLEKKNTPMDKPRDTE
jgi:hypothetical protein